MKKETIGLFVIYFVYLLIMFNSNVLLVQASTIDYDFIIVQNNPYNSLGDINGSSFNLGYFNDTSGNFTATYNFLNETVGTSGTSISYIDINTGTTIPEIVSSKKGHDKVIEFNKTSGDNVRFYDAFGTPQQYGSIDVWMLVNDTTPVSQFICLDGRTPDTTVFGIMITTDKFQYYDGTWNDLGKTAYDDQWYHLSLDFEGTIGGYHGLSQWEVRYRINDEVLGTYNYASNNHPNYTRVYSGTSDYLLGYMDSIGKTWESYILHENYYPEINIQYSNVLRTNRTEFHIDGDGVAFIDDTTNPTYLGWDLDYANPVKIKVDNDELSDYHDYGVFITAEGTQDTKIYNDSLNIQGDDINITYGIRLITTSAIGSYFRVVGNATSTIDILNLEYEVITSDIIRCKQYDGATYNTLFDLYGCSNVETLHEFNLHLDNGSIILRHFVNSTFNTSYSFNYIERELGLGSFEIYGKDIVAGILEFRIDYIGIYQYDSIAHNNLEYGYYVYNMGKTWNYNLQNLFDFNSNNNVKLFGLQGTLFYDDPTATYPPYPDFDVLRDFDNNDYFENFHGSSEGIENDSSLLLVGNSINLGNITFTIEGYYLQESTNLYYPTTTYNNVNQNSSYFYRDSNGRLRYTLNFDDSNTEYLKVVFNINNLQSVNRCVQFENYYNGFGEANFFVDYSDSSSSYFGLSPYITTTFQILPQDKLITTLTFSCTDNDNNDLSGLTSQGYIADIHLVHRDNLISAVSTTNLIGSIIPLILIFVPTFLIYKKFGKQYIIPLIMLFTFVFWLGQNIPSWLMVIIMSGCLIYLVLRWQIDKQRGAGG